MSTLTSTQRSTLKALVLATPALAALAASGDNQGIADGLNVASTFVVWRTSVSSDELFEAYVWTEMDSLTQARFNSLTLLLSKGTFNPSHSNIQSAVLQIFAGAALATTRSNIIALGKRFATLAERQFVTGTGTSGSPGLLVFEGSISASDVTAIMGAA